MMKKISRGYFFNKVLPKGFRRSGGSNSLQEEYQILKRLKGVIGIPQKAHFETHEDLECLQFEFIRGRPIDFYRLEPGQIMPILVKLSDIVTRIHRKGVHHRDFRSDNVKVDRHGDVHLLDFDQAIIGDPKLDLDFLCFRNLTGKNINNKPWIGLRDLTDNTLKFRPEIERTLEILRKTWRIGARSKANAPGSNICYYSWDFLGYHFNGERDWLTRWDPIYSRLGNQLRGSRILELGCNLGMFSSYCAIHGAKRCIGVDSVPDILNAAWWFAKSLGAKRCRFIQANLNDSSTYKKFHDKFDFVVILSLAYWLKHKKPLFNFLARQECVIYEGHEKASREKGEIDGTDFLRSLGFKNIAIICQSERDRLIYLATKR